MMHEGKGKLKDRCWCGETWLREVIYMAEVGY